MLLKQCKDCEQLLPLVVAWGDERQELFLAVASYLKEHVYAES